MKGWNISGAAFLLWHKLGITAGICYPVYMKRKVNKKSSKVNRRRSTRRSKGALPVFLTTLVLMISAGILGMLLLKFWTDKKSLEDKGAKAVSGSAALPEKGKQEDTFLWESIPGEDSSGNNSQWEKQEAAPQPTVPARYGDILADPEYMKENKIYAREAASKDEVTIGFAGDILMDDSYAIMANLKKRGGNIESGISEAMLAQMHAVDIMVVNNEFPFTNRGTPTEEKTFTFRADTDTVYYLHDMGADAAILANNHIYDFGEVGLLDTLDTLEEAGIPNVGAGRNLDEASAPLYFIINDMKIAIVAATQIERLENPDTKGATENSAGVFRCLNPDRLCKTVAQAKENSDFVIVYIHWGTENQAEPDWLQLEQAPKIAEAGADLIIGDHSHCLQGITYCGDTPVIYSLGNFWFNSKTLDTGMVRVTLDDSGLKSFQFVPGIQSGCRVDLAYGEDKERILSYMRSLSPKAVIDQEGYVSKP